jgi:hypothetical protein
MHHKPIQFMTCLPLNAIDFVHLSFVPTMSQQGTHKNFPCSLSSDGSGALTIHTPHDYPLGMPINRFGFRGTGRFPFIT